MSRCKGMRKDGLEQCQMSATQGDFCRRHVPELEKVAHKASVKDEELNNQVEKTQNKEEQPEDDKYAIAARRRAMNKARLKETGAIQGQNLFAPQRPGFVRRFVRGDENRLARLQDQGYTFVEENTENVSSDDLGNRKSKIVGTEKDGTPRRDYLMEIPEKFYREDQQAKESSIQNTEQMAKSLKLGGDKGIGSQTTSDGRSVACAREGTSSIFDPEG